MKWTALIIAIVTSLFFLLGVVGATSMGMLLFSMLMLIGQLLIGVYLLSRRGH